MLAITQLPNTERWKRKTLALVNPYVFIFASASVNNTNLQQTSTVLISCINSACLKEMARIKNVKRVREPAGKCRTASLRTPDNLAAARVNHRTPRKRAGIKSGETASENVGKKTRKVAVEKTESKAQKRVRPSTSDRAEVDPQQTITEDDFEREESPRAMIEQEMGTSPEPEFRSSSGGNAGMESPGNGRSSEEIMKSRDTEEEQEPGDPPNNCPNSTTSAYTPRRHIIRLEKGPRGNWRIENPPPLTEYDRLMAVEGFRDMMGRRY